MGFPLHPGADTPTLHSGVQPPTALPADVQGPLSHLKAPYVLSPLGSQPTRWAHPSPESTPHPSPPGEPAPQSPRLHRGRALGQQLADPLGEMTAPRNQAEGTPAARRYRGHEGPLQ